MFTAVPVTQLHRALSLCEEAGEVARYLLKEDLQVRPETRGNLTEELGDTLGQLCAIARSAGLDMDVIIDTTVNKLQRIEATGLKK